MIIRILRKCYNLLLSFIVNIVSVPIVEVYYGGFWKYRDYLIKNKRQRSKLYDAYLERSCASIGLKSQFESRPMLPHGLHGIHISDGAMLGSNITIFQNVTIGSNTLKDSKGSGAPTIGNNVYIGANSSIIGGIVIGDGCRIGANCCVHMNCAENQTIVMGGVRIIQHNQVRDNRFTFLEK